jgi:hypothetical protein
VDRRASVKIIGVRFRLENTKGMPTIPLVVFDESGHTGANLLDPNQPVFVLASVLVSDDEATSLLHDGGRESKFSSLKNSQAGRHRIVEILNSPVLGEGRLVMSGMHKPFMAVAKMVDLLVEPLARRDGLDLYERGANIALANMWHLCLPVFLGREPFALIQARFVAMVRTPTPKTIGEFYTAVERAYLLHQEKEFSTELATLLATRPIAERDANVWNDSQLDPSIPSFVQHASVWTGRLRTAFTIMHDQSKPLKNAEALLQAMMNTSEQPREIGHDRRKMLFPILANGIDFRDSAEIRQLQVADLVAGSAAYCLRAIAQNVSDPFVEELLATRALSSPYLPLWPERKITPEELGTAEGGGVDAADYVAAYVARRKAAAPATGTSLES